VTYPPVTGPVRKPFFPSPFPVCFSPKCNLLSGFFLFLCYSFLPNPTLQTSFFFLGWLLPEWPKDFRLRTPFVMSSRLVCASPHHPFSFSTPPPHFSPPPVSFAPVLLTLPGSSLVSLLWFFNTSFRHFLPLT